MKRLISNKGNILLIVILYASIILIGFTLFPLMLARHTAREEDLDNAFSIYEAEALILIAEKEILADIDDVKATMQYTPLLTGQEQQAKLLSILKEEFIAFDGTWKSVNLIPTTVTSRKCEVTVCFKNFEVPLSEMNMKESHILVCNPIEVTIQVGNNMCITKLHNLKIRYQFIRNKIECSFIGEDAYYEESLFIPCEVS